MSENNATNFDINNNTGSCENMANIVEWMEDNNMCNGGVCPVDYSDEDEDGDVIMTDSVHQNDHVEEQGPVATEEQSPEETEEHTPEEGEDHEAVDSEGEGEYGQSLSEGEEPCVYVVMKDDTPVAFHQLEDNAIVFMNNKISDTVIDYMGAYNVNTVKHNDGSVRLTGVYKNALFRWTTYNLATFRVVRVPIV